MSDLQQQTKSFFQRPEGKTGILFIVAGLLAAGWGLYVALPFLIVLLTNAIHAAALAGVLALMVFLVLDKRVRTLASYGFRSLMRAITGLVIEIDPIGILKGYVEDTRKRLETMQRSMGDLEGQKKKLKAIIDKNERDRVQSLQTAKVAHEKGAEYKASFVLQSRQAGRLQKSNITLQALYNKMQTMSKVLKKMHDAADFMATDLEQEVQVKESERNAIVASYNAFTSARKIIAGDTDQKALFDQAMEHLANDYAMKVGEIELFMEMSEGFIKSVDLENGVYEQDALDQFEQWEKKADQLLLNPPNTPQRVESDDKVRVSGLGEELEEDDTSGSFSDLFESKKG